MQQPSTMNIPTPRIHSLSLQFPLRTKIFIFKAEACLSVEFPLFSSIFQLFHMYSIFSCIFWVGLYMLMMVKTVCSTTEGHTPQTRYLAIHRMWENIWLFPYWFPLPPFSSATISVPFFGSFSPPTPLITSWITTLSSLEDKTFFSFLQTPCIHVLRLRKVMMECIFLHVSSFFYSYLRAILARSKLLLSYFLASEKNEVFSFFSYQKQDFLDIWPAQSRHDILKVEKIF